MGPALNWRCRQQAGIRPLSISRSLSEIRAYRRLAESNDQYASNSESDGNPNCDPAVCGSRRGLINADFMNAAFRDTALKLQAKAGRILIDLPV
jgi:hypothetical protein